MKRLAFVLLFLGTFGALAQTISYFNQGFLRQPSAAADRDYLGIYGTNIPGMVTNALYASIATNALNWSGSNAMNNLILSTSNTLNNTVLSSSNALNNTVLSSSNSLNNTIISSSNGVMSSVWRLDGNALGGGGKFLGSTDAQALQFRVNNVQYGLLNTDGSVTLGDFSTGTSASAANAVAIGFTATATAANSVAIGSQVASGNNGAVVIGFSSGATGLGALVLGSQATASGGFAIALGNIAADAAGASSLAAMEGAATSGDYAVALGAYTTSSGVGSTAMGLFSTANNDGSFVWGDSTASGNTDTAANQFIATSSGGAHFYTGGNGLVVDEGSGVWAFLSNGTVRATSHIAAGGKMWATNGYVNETYATNATMLCTLTNHFYFINAAAGTQPRIVLPDASLAPKIIYRFSMTNETASFIITNRTGAQSIRDGKSFSYTNYGPGEVSLISDGAHWWLASKGKTEMPNAAYSTQTNTTFASVTNSVTLQTTDHSGVSQGIFLDNSNWGANGVGSRIWITNRGDYMLTFSAMWAKTAGSASSCGIWMRKNGTDVANSATLMTVAQNTTNVMTVNLFAAVSVTSYFDFQGFSVDGNGILQSIAAITTPFNRPACPSIIVTVNKISD